MASQSPKATPQRPATSRLLAMKFMNRLGASADSSPAPPSPLALSEPSTPLSTLATSKKNGHDEGDDQRSAKRRRTLDAVETTPDSDMLGENSAVSMAEIEASMKASMSAEESRRQAAVKKRAAELGDEQWTWNAPLPPQIATKIAAATTAARSRTMAYASVMRVGFAEIDNVDQSGEAEPTKPRIMRFNMKSKASDGADGAGDDDAQEDGPLSSLGGSRKRSRSDAGGQRKKEAQTKLKNLTSLSSQGGQNTMKCHRCGRSGHKAVNCPSSNPQRSGSKSKKR